MMALLYACMYSVCRCFCLYFSTCIVINVDQNPFRISIFAILLAGSEAIWRMFDGSIPPTILMYETSLPQMRFGYLFRLRAVNEAGQSDPSNSVTVNLQEASTTFSGKETEI